MRTTRRLSPALLIVIAGLFPPALGARPDGPSSGEPPSPLPISTDAMDPEVATQLQEAREAVKSAAPESRGAAWGRFGELLFLYGLDEPARRALESALKSALESGARNPRWEYLLAILDEEAGRLTEAASRLETFARSEPPYLPALVRLGRLELSRDRPDEAEGWFREALGLDPRFAAAVHGLGLVAQERLDWADAARRFRRVLELQPSATSVHYPLGFAYRELGDTERAREHMARRGDGEVRLPDPYLEALADLEVGVGPYMMEGNRAALRGDHDRAAESFRRATEEDPTNVRAWRALAAALAHGGSAEDALAAYERLLALDPDSPSAHYNVARILLDEGRRERAETHLRTAVRLAPDYADAHYNLAALLWEAGRTTEAERAAALAVKHAPSDAEARLRHGRILVAVGRGDEAVRELERALELGLTDPGRRLEARLDLARLLGRSGRYEESAARYSRILDDDPGLEEAHFGRAMASLLAGDEAKAGTAFEQGVASLPGSLALRHALARFLATASSGELRDGARALSLAREVVDREPTVQHLETLAMALAESGRFEEAVDWQRKALDEARATGATEHLPALSERLRGYEEGRPARTPWRP